MSTRSSKTLLLFICALAVLLQLPAMLATSVEPSATEMSCAQVNHQIPHKMIIFWNFQLAGSDEERLLLCQLYESSALLAQLGALVNDGIERLASTQGRHLAHNWIPIPTIIWILGLARAIGSEGPRMEKRKHEVGFEILRKYSWPFSVFALW